MLKLADDPTTTKVQLRCGRRAGIYEVDGDRIYGWYISHDGEKYTARWHSNGRCYAVTECDHDLVNAPEPPVTVEVWANVNQGCKRVYVVIYDDPVVAKTNKQSDCIACCVPVPITYRPGEGLEGA